MYFYLLISITDECSKSWNIHKDPLKDSTFKMKFVQAFSALILSRPVSSFITSSGLSHRTMVTTSLAVSSSTREILLQCPKIPLRDGTLHPSIGFGTYKVGFMPASASSVVAGGNTLKEPERSAQECILDALDCGYRFFECAEFYGNEIEVGKAIVSSGIKREDLFLCSKVWTSTIDKGPHAVREQLEKTLSDLRTDYVDLYCK
jgi:hypothetical protein